MGRRSFIAGVAETPISTWIELTPPRHHHDAPPLPPPILNRPIAFPQMAAAVVVGGCSMAAGAFEGLGVDIRAVGAAAAEK